MMAAITTGTGLGMSGRGRWARGRGGVFGPVLLWGWVKCWVCGAGGAWLTGGWAGCWWAVLVCPVAGAVLPVGGPGCGWVGRVVRGSPGGGPAVGGRCWCTRWPVRFRRWVGRGVCTGRWPRRPVARSGRGPVARSGRAGRGRRSGVGCGCRAGPEGACRGGAGGGGRGGVVGGGGGGREGAGGKGGAGGRWGVERRRWNAPWWGFAWGCRKFPPPTVTPGVPWGRVVRGRVRFHVRGPAAAG